MRRVLTIALAASVLFAGCTVNDDPRFHVPWPSIGDSYSYVGDDGTTLDAEIVAQPVPGFSIHYRMTLNATGADPYHFVEHFGPGFTLNQQVAECGGAISIDNETPFCAAEGRTLIRGVQGLSGGLSTSFLWGKDLWPSRPLQVEAPAPLFPGLQVAFGFEEERSCISVQDDLGAERARIAGMLYFTYGGRRVLCAGSALPHEFTTLAFADSGFIGSHVTYRLTAFVRGGGPSVASLQDLPTAAAPIGEMDRFECPRFILQHEEPHPFTGREAHQAASEASPFYRSLFADPCGSVVFASEYSDGSSWHHPILGAERKTHQRFIQVVTAAGEAWRFVIQKNVSSLQGAVENVSYHMGPPEQLEDFFEWQRAYQGSDEQMGVRQAHEQVTRLTGRTDPVRAGLTHEVDRSGWAPKGGPLLRTDGYEIHIRHRAAPLDGSFVYPVYLAAFDGATGHPIMIQGVPEGL